MGPFDLHRPTDLNEAISLNAHSGRTDVLSAFIAGGTDMVQLLQENVLQPRRLVSLCGLLDEGIHMEAHELRLGAAATMAKVAAHPDVLLHFSLIAEAILNSASPQVRNQATIAGNLLQRTRCPYFRDVGYEACNKRNPGSGCAAIGGENRWHAILGASESCIAVHASDLAVALVALDASVSLLGPKGQRHVNLDKMYQLPGDTPHIEADLKPGEIITAITVPRDAAGLQCSYIKVRDRASFEFAVVSAAVALDIKGRQIRDARIAVGGVATRPWRLPQVEAKLKAAHFDINALDAAAEAATQGARGQGHNGYKIELMKRAVRRALETAGGFR
ncbi:xanthine dehydrogenase family protein subunit M (plasmid) [Rhizobium ruizarguesonis]|uniref:FAD binding domain-containing protein n=1 Tax=Rhizobium ruizarguesonis TaxID=2081791 RepID=UPI0010315017|nr:xanthine dehydrogenase family protein subunit M [Rhizobium ruizarguesonis]TBB15067.1 xanthine dehydrogenase family protein subunit M [Rhizobium ruizarguesonis]